MYSLDVNFLKDRDISGGYSPTPTKTKKPKKPIGTMVPLIAGVIAMVLLPAIAGGLLFFLNSQQAEVQKEIEELEGEITKIDALNLKIKQLEDQINQVNSQNTALASVFTHIKPWSAILKDVSDRIPPGVQIDSIDQSELESSNSDNSTIPTLQLTIEGIALSYNDVNDFLLTLQRSSFLKAEATQLATAILVDNPNELEFTNPELSIEVEVDKVIEYTITTELNDIPASQLIRELDSKGAVGLVTRIKSLEEQGVIKP